MNLFEGRLRRLGAHDCYTDADADRPDSVCDSNGQVVLYLCKICGRAEAELEEPCIKRIGDRSHLIKAETSI